MNVQGESPTANEGPLAQGGWSLYFVALNRNKKAITLNLNSERGRAQLLKLVEQSDVLVHTQPAHRAKALGLDYPSLQQANPRLVHLAISGFGSTGSYARYTAFDPIVQALSGAASMTGFTGGPPTLSHIPYVDFGTGLYGALAVTLALLHRERTGLGQSVDLALFSTGLSFVATYGILAEAALNGLVRRSIGNDLVYAVGGCFPARDGHLVISCVADALWRRLCRTIQRLDLLDDPRLKDDLARYQYRDLVNGAIAGWTSQRTAKEAARILAEAGIPVGPVQFVDEVAAHPQAQALEMAPIIQQPGIGNVSVGGIAMKFSETPGRIRLPAPAVGEHNQEVYDHLLGEGVAKGLAEEGTI